MGCVMNACVETYQRIPALIYVPGCVCVGQHQLLVCQDSQREGVRVAEEILRRQKEFGTRFEQRTSQLLLVKLS